MSTSVTDATAAAAEPFSRRMRIVTRQKHKLSDALVNAKLVFALSDPAVWLDGLLCFQPIFAYLEQHVSAAQGLPLHAHRAGALEADIRHYCGQLQLDADATLADRRPTVAAYLEHLERVRAEDERLLLAYVYHLYMGMLSGGQIISKKRRMFAKLSTKKDDGEQSPSDGYRTTEYDLRSGPSIGEMKAEMRQTLDRLGEEVDEHTRGRLLEESIAVFELNNAMVHSIRGGGAVAVRRVAMAVGAVALVWLAFRWMVV